MQLGQEQGAQPDSLETGAVFGADRRPCRPLHGQVGEFRVLKQSVAYLRELLVLGRRPRLGRWVFAESRLGRFKGREQRFKAALGDTGLILSLVAGPACECQDYGGSQSAPTRILVEPFLDRAPVPFLV